MKFAPRATHVVSLPYMGFHRSFFMHTECLKIAVPATVTIFSVGPGANVLLVSQQTPPTSFAPLNTPPVNVPIVTEEIGSFGESSLAQRTEPIHPPPTAKDKKLRTNA